MYEVSVARQSNDTHALAHMFNFIWNLHVFQRNAHNIAQHLKIALFFSCFVIVFNISVYTHWHTNLSAIYLSQNHLLNQVNIVSRFLVRSASMFCSFSLLCFLLNSFYLIYSYAIHSLRFRIGCFWLFFVFEYHSSNIRMFLNKILKR